LENFRQNFDTSQKKIEIKKLKKLDIKKISLDIKKISLDIKKFKKYRTFKKSAGYLKKITYPKTDFTSNYIKLHVIFFSLWYRC